LKNKRVTIKIKIGENMKTSNLIRILLVILVFLWVSLKGQKMPEIIPFKLVPLNYEDNRKIELGIELIYPQKISSLVEVHREETLDIIYQRIALEIMKPEHANQIFVIDGNLYYLLNMTRYNALPHKNFFVEK
jgi:hypothetical protein|tara:strand:- start:69 stop:467 length:399 start_codon:yes stop_codon:yes gene_type:complete